MFATPDATSELVELQQSEMVGVLDHHDRRVRHVDPDLDDGRRHEHVGLAGAERAHRRFLVRRRHLPVQQPEAEVGQLLLPQPFELLGGRPGLELVGTFDQRTHHVGLVPRRHLFPHPLVDRHALQGPGPDDRGVDGRPAGRQLAQLGLVEVAVDQHRRGARDRCRRHHQHVGRVSLGPQQVALFDAEPVLLVDDRDAEVGELDAPVDQRVRPDEDVDLAGEQAGRDLAPVGGRGAVGEQRGAHRPFAEQRTLGRDGEHAEHPAHGQLVLFGQHLGRGHERALVPALHRHEQRGERDDRLPGTDLALEQPVHGRGQRHVGPDLCDRTGLVRGQRERERGVELGHERTVDRVHDPGRFRRERALAGDQRQLHAQELVELQPLRGGVAFAHRVGTVDAAVCAPPVDQVVIGADVTVEGIGEPARFGAVETRRDRAPQLPREHLGLPRLRVHRHDGAGDIRPGVGIGEHVDHGVRHLALAPVALDLPEQRDLRARPELTLPPPLVEEHDLEQAGAVVDGRVDDGALAVAGAAGMARTHLGVDRRLLPDLELVDLGPFRAVDVAARVVLEQIEHGLDAHLGQARAQLVADRLQLGDAVRRQLAQREAGARRRSGRRRGHGRRATRRRRGTGRAADRRGARRPRRRDIRSPGSR